MAALSNLCFSSSAAFARGLEGFRLRLPTQLQPTGISELDALLAGGVPRGSLIELCGSSSSGRTSVSFSLLAATTQRQEACAYVDVSDSLDPLSLASAGVDLTRLLWIRCGSDPIINAPQSQQSITLSAAPQKSSLPFLENTGRKHKHSQSWQHPRDQIRGIESALPSIMGHTEAPKNAANSRKPQSATLPFPEPHPTPRITTPKPSSPVTPAANSNLRAKKGTPGPWKRLDQALRTTDLLLHSGGWGVVILDLGGIPWIDARRIELSTWFRFRRTIENTPTILVLLAEESCAKSCSSLVLHCRRKQENWTHLDVQKETSGVATLDGFQVESKIVSSRTGLPLMDSAQWTTNTLWNESF